MLQILETKSDPKEIAAVLGVSERAMVDLVCRMARKGSLRITEIRPNEKTGADDV